MNGRTVVLTRGELGLATLSVPKGDTAYPFSNSIITTNEGQIVSQNVDEEVSCETVQTK